MKIPSEKLRCYTGNVIRVKLVGLVVARNQKEAAQCTHQTIAAFRMNWKHDPTMLVPVDMQPRRFYVRSCGSRNKKWFDGRHPFMEGILPVRFKSLAYGARFKYSFDAPKTFVRIGHDTVAEWNPEFVADYWIGQSVCSAADKEGADFNVWLDEK